VFQLEKGEKGTPHYQGYVFFNKRTSMAMAKKQISAKAHFEAARGTPLQNRAYCTKKEGRINGPFEFGVIPQQGRRNDLINMKKLIDSGKDNKVVAEEYFGSFLRYHKGINAYRLLNQQQRSWKTTVVVIYGPTGTGKSAFCRDMFKGAYWKPPGTKWWDNYVGQSVVIFDDFNVPWFGFDTLKRLLDRYPLLVETKGGHTQFLAKTIVVTSNNHPNKWYWKLFQSQPHSYSQLERRIDILASKYSLDSQFLFEHTNPEHELKVPPPSVPKFRFPSLPNGTNAEDVIRVGSHESTLSHSSSPPLPSTQVRPMWDDTRSTQERLRDEQILRDMSTLSEDSVVEREYDNLICDDDTYDDL
jgi:hypothetical protein